MLLHLQELFLNIFASFLFSLNITIYLPDMALNLPTRFFPLTFFFFFLHNRSLRYHCTWALISVMTWKIISIECKGMEVRISKQRMGYIWQYWVGWQMQHQDPILGVSAGNRNVRDAVKGEDTVINITICSNTCTKNRW